MEQKYCAHSGQWFPLKLEPIYAMSNVCGGVTLHTREIAEQRTRVIKCALCGEEKTLDWVNPNSYNSKEYVAFEKTLENKYRRPELREPVEGWYQCINCNNGDVTRGFTAPIGTTICPYCHKITADRYA